LITGWKDSKQWVPSSGSQTERSSSCFSARSCGWAWPRPHMNCRISYDSQNDLLGIPHFSLFLIFPLLILPTGQQKNQSMSVARDKGHSLLHNVQTDSLAQPASDPMATMGPLSGANMLWAQSYLLNSI
jgi:hypothetical protein